jgi:2-keto-4-pentenoate hydratase/2-oxohepta-3-ene-1,7-dioic acid hydratase in catechol pathway
VSLTNEAAQLVETTFDGASGAGRASSSTAASGAPSDRSMRLLTRAASDGERLAVANHGDAIVDVDDLLGGGPWTMARLLTNVDATLEAIRGGLVSSPTAPARGRADIVLLPPVTRPGKIIAVGRNYHEHAAEEGQTAPAAPVVFAKFPNSLVGDQADIVWRAADTGRSTTRPSSPW